MYSQHEARLRKLEEQRLREEEEERLKLRISVAAKKVGTRKNLSTSDLNGQDAADRLYRDFKDSEKRLKMLQRRWEQEEKAQIDRTRFRGEQSQRLRAESGGAPGRPAPARRPEAT